MLEKIEKKNNFFSPSQFYLKKLFNLFKTSFYHEFRRKEKKKEKTPLLNMFLLLIHILIDCFLYMCDFILFDKYKKVFIFGFLKF
jgi:hypothetical protein